MLINLNEVKHKVKNDLENLQFGECIIVKTFKKDRYVSIKMSKKEYIIFENGFKHKSYVFEFNFKKELLNEFMKIIALECPNSNKVWYLYKKNK